MRKILGALAVGTLTITLSAPAAHAAPAANVAQQVQPQRPGAKANRRPQGSKRDTASRSESARSLNRL